MYSNESALVLFSGGQDSTTCLFWALKNFKEVRAVSFSYGQKHAYELDVAKTIARVANVPHEIHAIDVLGSINNHTSLTDPNIPVDPVVPRFGLPNTFVPGRNLVFLTFAAIVARKYGIRYIITGVSQTDYSGYPDCREKFIKSTTKTLNLAMESEFEILTPLMARSKEATWQLADELGVLELIRHNTLTCYNGIMADGCGRCPACQLRNIGLQKYLRKREKIRYYQAKSAANNSSSFEE
jgi:queuosine biosynthesis protein QueC